MHLPAIAMPKIPGMPDISRFTGLAAPVVAIAVSILVTVFVTWPKFSEVLTLRTSNQDLAVRLSSLSEKAAILQSLSSDQEELELHLARAEQLLPSDKNVFSVIQFVEDVSGSSGVLLNRLEVSPGAVGGPGQGVPASASPPQASAGPGGGTTVDAAPKVSLKLAVTSDYLSFLEFIGSILSFSRVVSVGDLSLSASGSTGQAYEIRSSFTLNAFWQSLPSELASVESPVEVLTNDEKELLEKVKFTGITQTFTPSGGDGQTQTIPTGKIDIFAPTF